jgi:hypothetical protein
MRERAMGTNTYFPRPMLLLKERYLCNRLHTLNHFQNRCYDGYDEARLHHGKTQHRGRNN